MTIQGLLYKYYEVTGNNLFINISQFLKAVICQKSFSFAALTKQHPGLTMIPYNKCLLALSFGEIINIEKLYLPKLLPRFSYLLTIACCMMVMIN